MSLAVTERTGTQLVAAVNARVASGEGQAPESKSLLRSALVVTGIALAAYLGLNVPVQSVVIQQHSMVPSLEEGQRLFVNKTAYLFGDPQRGDVVVFHPPGTTASPLFVKRIVALPGETVEIRTGAVYVEGRPLTEPYVEHQARYELGQFIVPEGRYFVLGDNRRNSIDSHNGWTVPAASIVGKVWISVWPPREWGPPPTYVHQANSAAIAVSARVQE